MADSSFTAPILDEFFHLVKDSKDVTSDTIKETYDRWVLSYDEEVMKCKYHGPSKGSSILSQHCPEKNISILDCGAGTGLVGKELHALGYTNITALDLSSKSLAVAEQKGVYKELICADLSKEAMPFEDNCFDALICCGCFVPYHLHPSCLPELVRVVKPDGNIVVVMRQSYIEAVKGEEGYFSKDYQLEFNEVTQELELSKRFSVTSKLNFPDYLGNSPGLVFVWKVL